MHFFFGEVFVQVFCLLKTGSFVLLLSFKSSLYILDAIPQNVCFAKLISKSVDCLFILLTVSFTEQNIFILMKPSLSVFSFRDFIFLVSYQKSHQAHLNFLLYFKLQTMIHFGLWSKWSRAKTNWILPRECASHGKYPFQQHKTWLYTWTSPIGQYPNQIDYILCSLCWRSCIQSAKTRSGAGCNSDHQLLKAKFRLKLKKAEKNTRPARYDLNQIPYEYAVKVTDSRG